jgi:hydroxyacid-oxoacid transhydrogenase
MATCLAQAGDISSHPTSPFLTVRRAYGILGSMTDYDRAFEMAVASVRFGPGVTREVGFDLADWGAKHVLVVTDPTVRQLPPLATVLDSLDASRLRWALYDRVRVEPTDESFVDAIEFARPGEYDAFVAVGGGSAIDTAKAVNLYTTYPPADFLDYVNPPIGKGLPVPGPLKPLIAGTWRLQKRLAPMCRERHPSTREPSSRIGSGGSCAS